MKHERIRLQTLATQLQADVQALLASEEHKTISQLTSWDAYFTEKRQQLESQLELRAA